MEVQFRRSVLSGRISAPPSPAAAQRALIIASIAPGQSVISNLPDSPDIQATLSACSSSGADIVTADGVADIFGGSFFLPPLLDCQESNSTLKLFLGLASSFPSPVEFTGSDRLTVMPLGSCAAYLDRIGASVECETGFLPLKISSPASEARMQYFPQLGTAFLSGMLLSAPLLESDTEIVVEGAFSYRAPLDGTIALMKKCGIEFIAADEDFISVAGSQPYSPLPDFAVTASPLLSSFPVLAAALCGKVALQGMAPYPELESLIQSFGAEASSSENSFFAAAGPLEGTELEAPKLGHLLLHALVLGSAARGETRINGMAEIGRRSADRLRILIRVLSRMGARINESEHTLLISGSRLTGAEIDPEGDSRVAMAASAAALAADGPSAMRGAECILGHYPSFFSDLAKLGAIARQAQELR